MEKGYLHSSAEKPALPGPTSIHGHGGVRLSPPDGKCVCVTDAPL